MLNIRVNTGSRIIMLEGENTGKALDILNSFAAIRAEDCGGGPISGSGITINYYDSRRQLQLIGDSIYIGSMKYTGDAGCLDSWYELCEEAAAE